MSEASDSFNPCRVFWLVATVRCSSSKGDLIAVVSIPGGFSGSLRLAILPGVIAANILFQSLSGFLARCDGGFKMVLLP